MFKKKLYAKNIYNLGKTKGWKVFIQLGWTIWKYSDQFHVERTRGIMSGNKTLIFSHEDKSHVARVHFWSFPVVNVILKLTIADTELEILEKGAVFHDVQSVENVAPALCKTVCDQVCANVLDENKKQIHSDTGIPPQLHQYNQPTEETSLARVRQSFMSSLRGTVFAML